MIKGEDFSVTRAKVRDFKEIKKIQESGYGEVFWKSFDLWLERLLSSKEYLIHYQGKVVGFIHVEPKDVFTLHILNFCLYREYQGIGLGTAVLGWVKGEYRAKGYREVTLLVREGNEYVINFYKGNGFIEYGRKKGYYRDTKEDAIKMVSSV